MFRISDFKDEDKEEDIPVTENDKYIPIHFPILEYMYDEELSSKEVVLFHLIKKWSNKSSIEKKAWFKINKAEEWLGYSDKTITSSLIELNSLGLVATK